MSETFTIPYNFHISDIKAQCTIKTNSHSTISSLVYSFQYQKQLLNTTTIGSESVFGRNNTLSIVHTEFYANYFSLLR